MGNFAYFRVTGCCKRWWGSETRERPSTDTILPGDCSAYEEDVVVVGEVFVRVASEAAAAESSRNSRSSAGGMA
jgi:hypothetical protein